MTAETFAADIPETIARAAHAGTSFVPETRATQERDEYAATLAGDFETLSKYATNDEKRSLLETEFARYRQGYRARVLRHLASRSRCVSWMIAGRSNFPVSRMEKRNAIEHRRLEDVIGFRTRALHAIKRVLTPELAPVMLGDSDAGERLASKIEKAEKLQERMKAANAAIRKRAKAGPAAQVAALAVLGFSDPLARELLTPDFAGRAGFPSYQITNNGAEIRRLKARAGAVERLQAEPAETVEGANARVEDVPAENRVRLFFPGKPASDVRERLKRGGFRWTPSLGCWQAYRNHGTIETAKREAGGAKEAA